MEDESLQHLRSLLTKGGYVELEGTGIWQLRGQVGKKSYTITVTEVDLMTSPDPAGWIEHAAGVLESLHATGQPPGLESSN